MIEEQKKIYYWVSRLTLQLSQILITMDKEMSNKLFVISKVALEKLQDLMSDSPVEDSKIREEIQRYVDEIRGETGDK
jgi:hypothetical protein